MAADELADSFKINHSIRAREVRLVGDNVPLGVYSLFDALKIADQQNLDLVEISPNALPPVCRVIDFKKFLYNMKKKQKEIKANSTKVTLKEVRFGPQTDEHDYQFKLKHAQKFIAEGAKVKAYVFFKGRSILYKEQGTEVLRRLIKDLEDVARLDQEPKLEGKRMFIHFSPIPKKK